MLGFLMKARFAFSILTCFLGAICHAEEVDLNRFEKLVIATNLIQPMQMAVAPDGRVFLIELAGVVKLIDPVTKEVKTIAKIDVTTAQENGLIGIALDPKFSENQWVYLQYSPPEFPGQQISRFRFQDELLEMSSEEKLLRYEEQRRECCHHAGSMTFGPDGNLYIGTGDNTHPFGDSQSFAPLDERPDREPWDAQRTAGNTKSYNGKVLRIRPNVRGGGYTIPDGNLFPKDGSIGHPEIYVMGCRNPWRISVDQRTGFLYWGDVGPDAGGDGPRGPKGYDEVNQARNAGNFGWPYFIGPNRPYAMVDFTTGTIGSPQNPDHPFNNSVNNTGSKNLPPLQPPFLYYPGGTSAEFPEVGTGGRTACAGPVFYFDPQSKSKTQFPDAYNSTLFAYEWSRNWIMAVHMDKDSHIERLERFLPDMKIVRPIDLQFDSLGRLYVIEYGETWGINPEACLLRIDYVRGNRTPVAKATIENNIGREPLKIKLKSEGTFDKDGDRLAYRWIATPTTGDRKTERILAESAEADVTINEPGSYTVSMEVRDPSGSKDVATFPLIVGNARPEVQFLSPKDGDFYTPGEKASYKLLIQDMEDGTSDFEAAEEKDLKSIESTAPSRTFVQLTPINGRGEGKAKLDPPGLALMRKSDCFNCHTLDRPLVGPMLSEIAKKYRNVPGALDASTKRVIDGSTGVWGKVAMLPHGHHTPDQVREMVQYVFSIQTESNVATQRGLRSDFETPRESSGIQLDAFYTDIGRDAIPALTGTSSIRLRSRMVQAEHADEIQKGNVVNSEKAQGKAYLGSINHGGFLRFDSISLDRVSQIVVRAASVGAGGTIELHCDKIDGPLLGSVDVEVNGDWETFVENTIKLPENRGSEIQGRHDLYFLFKNDKKRNKLMNIDTIEFKEG